MSEKEKRVCSLCRIRFPLSSFSWSDKTEGYLRRSCIFCERKKDKARRLKNVAAKDGRCATISARNKEQRAAARRQRIAEQPIAHKARQAARLAIAKGQIQREGCCVCRKVHAKDTSAVAHHCDYSKPLDLMWLCTGHHKAWHSLFIAEGKFLQPDGTLTPEREGK